MVFLNSLYSTTPGYDTDPLPQGSNSKRELQNKQRLVKGEVMMCVGSDSKVDKITIAHSLLPSGLVLNLK